MGSTNYRSMNFYPGRLGSNQTPHIDLRCKISTLRCREVDEDLNL